VAGKNDQGEGMKSPAYTVTISACPGEDGAVPVAAGTLTGPTVNDCPSNQAALAVAAIDGATSYSWSVAYAADDVETVITTEPAYTASLLGLAEGQAVTYTVSGVNAVGTGVASAPHVVAKQRCLAPKPVIAGNPEWKTVRNDTVVYTTVCPAVNMMGTATCNFEKVIKYNWYWQLIGEDPELKLMKTEGLAILDLGSPGYTYNFAVAAVTADGESPMSDVIQVVGTQCCTPNPPGGAEGTVAIYPTASGFFPGTAPYSFGISNCAIQEKTGKLESSVELTCNRADLREEKPVTGYAFWVKTTESGSFTKVLTTGKEPAERKIVVNGTTYPSGTYMVTAISECGDSDFGNNWVAVEIRNDCPPPAYKPAASTFSARKGGIFTEGVLTNDCTGAGAVTLDINPSKPASSYIWRNVLSPSIEAKTHTQSSLTDLSVADNGTYYVTYMTDVDGVSTESHAAEITINMKLCPPTFATKPAVIVAPATYAVAVLNAPPAVVAPHIVKYEWFFDGRLALDTEVGTIGTASSLTFHLLKEGAYKVRAISLPSESEFSEAITITKVTAPDAYTRADLIGTYDVSDYRYGTFAAYAHTLTIAEHTHADSITITGLATVKNGTTFTTLKAAVSFTADGKTNGGNYGTITIPQQVVNVDNNGTASPYRFTKVEHEGAAVTCLNTPQELTIKFINGKPGIEQTGVRFALWKWTNQTNTCTSAGNCFGGGATRTTKWTKQ
jgi:hypothetical protein